MSKYYVTTSIPYVNAEPHIGFAMELVIADVLARYAKQQGSDVIFSTGTDEHGGKIAEKAKEANLTPKEFTDKVSKHFIDLCKSLNISNNRFIRTTDPDHEKRAQLIWKKLEKDIYKSNYVGWYCTGDEAFFTETEVKEYGGICPNHNQPFEKIEEENYFFKLSAYEQKILKAIESDQFKIIPGTKKNEILSLIRSGLEDISISRPKDKISWGIPVPGDSEQVIYVWFEALMNYITVLGYPDGNDFKDYWPANVQVIGKDIIRFHAAIWPAMLFSLGLPLPKVLYAHGFINIEGQKISKSLGNSISPEDIIANYGADPLRYYLLRHIPSYSDGDFSLATFEAAYNNELANELGNALSRTLAMVERYLDAEVGKISSPEHDIASYERALSECRFDKALEEVFERVKGLNQYIEEEKPWELAKNDDKEHLKEVLVYQVSSLIQIANLLEPFLPATAQKIQEAFKDGKAHKMSETLFPQEKTMIELTDTHCHIHSIDQPSGDSQTVDLWSKLEGGDVSSVLTQAEAAGVTRLITVGCNLEDSKLAISVANEYDSIWATLGIHPHEAKNYVGEQEKLKAFEALANQNKVVAIGECGLDYYYNHSDPESQKELLRFQLELALKYDLPLIFHVREAFDDFWPIFESYKNVKGVLHSFTDNLANMDKAIGYGLFIGVNGIATFAKNPDQTEVYRQIPTSNLVLETDSPFLTPTPLRGNINEPKNVRLVAEYLANLRGESLENLATQTTDNAQQLFSV